VNTIIERYFSHFLDCVQEQGGDVTDTAGDGIMAVFQDDDPFKHARKAALTVLRILEVTKGLNQDRPEGGDPIAVHMGLNSGRAIVGATRFEGLRGTLWTFTASGPVTNLAARLGAVAVPGTILVGPETARRISSDFVLEPLGPQIFKNLEAVDVHRLMGRRDMNFPTLLRRDVTI
jgi:class 3 adenylate cyclase